MRGCLQLGSSAILQAATLELLLIERRIQSHQKSRQVKSSQVTTEGQQTEAKHQRLISQALVGSNRMRATTFELAIPPHLPPSTALCTRDTCVLIEWLLVFTFQLPSNATADEGPCIPWHLPIHVMPAGQRKDAAKLAAAAASFIQSTRIEEQTLDESL